MTTTQRRAAASALLLPLALVAAVGMLVVEVTHWTRLPVFLDNTEIYLVFGIRSLAEEGVLYRDLATLPIIVHVYQPLAYLPSALLLQLPWMAGAGLLPTARLLNLPILLATLALLYRIARHLADSREVAMIAVITAVYLHAAFFAEFIRIRPENGAMLFTLAALLLALERPHGWWRWAAISIVIANFFKPTFLALPLAIALRLLAEGDQRLAIRFAALCGGTFAGLVGVTAVAFGPAYLTHTIGFAAANPDFPLWKVPVYVLIWINVFGPAFLPLAAGSGILVRRDGARSFLPLYLLACTALSLVGLTKTGADIHYLIELSFLLLLGFVAVLPRRGGVALMTAVCALAIGFQVFRTGTATVRYCAHRHARLACDYTSPIPPSPAAARRLATHETGAVVFDEVLAFESGRVVALDWTLLDLLDRSHAVDPAPLFALIDSPSTTHVVLPRRANALLEDLYQAALRAGFRPTPDGGDRVLERLRAAPSPDVRTRRTGSNSEEIGDRSLFPKRE